MFTLGTAGSQLPLISLHRYKILSGTLLHGDDLEAYFLYLFAQTNRKGAIRVRKANVAAYRHATVGDSTIVRETASAEEKAVRLGKMIGTI